MKNGKQFSKNKIVLVATKNDFTPQNRKEFCSKIATGDYDIAIIGHSQFQKIPLSYETQKKYIDEQILDIENSLSDMKNEKGNNRYSIKQLEITIDGLEKKLEKLANSQKKDDVVTFEELGIDKLFVDESHEFKNLFSFTKMTNISGVAQTEAQKSTDMFTKTRYMDEITGGKGTIFATGTPISNSMVELFTIMRYLQYDTLKSLDLKHFDNWAANFGECKADMEISPEGNSFRMKTRFAKFTNLPELINIWKEAADIQTADMLNCDEFAFRLDFFVKQIHQASAKCYS